MEVERDHTQSRLPRFKLVPDELERDIGAVNDHLQAHNIRNASSLDPSNLSPSRDSSILISPSKNARPQPLTTFPAALQPNVPSTSNSDNDSNTAKPRNSRRNAPVTASRKENNGPPLSMITQGYFDTLSPTEIAAQSMSVDTSIIAQNQIENPPPTPAVLKPSRPSSTLIKPIRGFKPSSRRQSAEMERRSSQDGDNTLRALEGQDSSYLHRSNREYPEEQNSDESDLFLRAAREEEQMSQQLALTNGNAPSQSDNRRSRTEPRGSFLQSNNSLSRRRGSDNERSSDSRFTNEQDNIGQALTYRNTREPAAILDGTSRSRYYGSDSRSMPSTPRGVQNREVSPPESQASFGGRRPSIPDPALPARSTYRASNLSYSTPRTYNSSPLVSRPEGMHDAQYDHRMVNGAPSAVSAASTRAPSAADSVIWDEMLEMKQRIAQLESQRRMNERMSNSRASDDRPVTATTTVTTISSSPRRARANSFSPSEQVAVDPTTSEAHPILQAALAKSKPVLSQEAYKALAATVSEALAIITMMGSSGKPGPFAGSQSVVNGSSSATDRQVRRKADDMCRSLTELCIALTEPKPDNQVAIRPGSRDRDAPVALEPINTQRQLVSTDLARVKSSPRALSRLEARRSSLLATSNLPSPRYAPSESGTPTQNALAGRRTSLYLRNRRGGTEEPEEEDDNRFRAPSRAVTEVNGMRHSPREYTSQQPLPERQLGERQLPEHQLPERQLPERQAPVQSSLPVRRHYPSTSLTNTAPTPMPPVSTLGGRRYLERSTPERDPQSLAGRLAEDRGQRKSSISQNLGLGRTTSLNRRTRPSSGGFSTIGQPSGYKG